jgi:O-methyltransferase
LGAKHYVTRSVRGALRRLGYELHRTPSGEQFPVDFDEATVALCRSVRPYTMTSPERMFALRQATQYVVEASIPGAIVECGVWRGGSMLLVARTLVELDATDRDLYLFDTFTTMTRPGEEDVDVAGNRAIDLYDAAVASPVFSYLPLEDVKRLMRETGYPSERLHFVQGMVEETIPESAPNEIALCRLDTDLYASTKHEMEHLFWRIAEGGVLLIDDYGHFLGAKRAVDEYLTAIGGGVLLDRIDFTGRLVVMTADARGRARAYRNAAAPAS